MMRKIQIYKIFLEILDFRFYGGSRQNKIRNLKKTEMLNLNQL